MEDIFVLHISDIHIHNEQDRNLLNFDSIVTLVKTKNINSKYLFIVISGDIAFSGEKYQYDLVKERLDNIKNNIIQRFSLLSVEFIICPGNHDGKFKSSSKTRDLLIKAMRESQAYDSESIEICTKPQEEYFNFESSLVSNENIRFESNILKIHKYELAGRVIEFWTFNASWISSVPETPGSLYFPTDYILNNVDDSVDLRFAVIHHPLNWYIQSNYHPLRAIFLDKFNAVFSGHEHSESLKKVSDIHASSSCIFFEAGSLGPHQKDDSINISWISLDISLNEVELEKYVLKDSIFKLENQSKFSIEEKKKLLSLSKEFALELEELSAPFYHPNKDSINLSDVFVPVDFDDLSYDNQGIDKVLGYKDLKDKLFEKNRLFIKGEEQYGKTSLVNFVVKDLFSDGFYPVKASGINFNINNMKSSLDDRIKYVYGDKSIASFCESDFEKRVLVVDDFDRLTVSGVGYLRLLEFFEKKFKYFIFLVNDRFDLTLLVDDSVSEKYKDFIYFRIKGFSYLKRTELIKKWYQISGSLDKSSFQKKVHIAQEHIDNAISKALIPSNAFNTLMLLQALESTQKSQVVDFGIVQHYDILIKSRLKDGGFNVRENDGVYSYLSNLAWWMASHDLKEVHVSEMHEYHLYFNENIHATDCFSILNKLIQCRILNFDETCYKFKYPSARYFFLANYIAENVDTDVDVKDYALAACRMLYKQDFANLIIFLTGRTTSKKIIFEIVAVLNNLLNECSSFNIIQDVNVLNGWIDRTAKIAVSLPKTDEEAIRRKRESDERANQQSEKSLDADVDSVLDLDPISQLNLVLKTSEILGLILKSKFASLDIKTKNLIIEAIFSGPLRGMSFFFNVLKVDSNSLVLFLADKMLEKYPKKSHDQCVEMTKKLIFNVLGKYCLSLFARQGEIIGSPDVMLYVDRYVENTKSSDIKGLYETYNLVRIAADLSFPRNIKEREIKESAKKFDSNFFAYNVLQGLVANHIYMFQISIDMKQKLASYVNIEIKDQITRESFSSSGKKIQNKTYKYTNPLGLMNRLTNKFMSNNKDVMDSIANRDKKK